MSSNAELIRRFGHVNHRGWWRVAWLPASCFLPATSNHIASRKQRNRQPESSRVTRTKGKQRENEEKREGRTTILPPAGVIRMAGRAHTYICPIWLHAATILIIVGWRTLAPSLRVIYLLSAPCQPLRGRPGRPYLPSSPRNPHVEGSFLCTDTL